MKLKELLPEYSGKVSDDKLSSVALNSQEISKGDLYISIAKDISLQKMISWQLPRVGVSRLAHLWINPPQLHWLHPYATLSTFLFQDPSQKMSANHRFWLETKFVDFSADVQ